MEDFFEQNRELLLGKGDLPIDHRQEMVLRLSGLGQPKLAARRGAKLVVWLAVAAAITAVSMVVVLTIDSHSDPLSCDQRQLTAKQIEALETQRYYEMKRDIKIDQLWQYIAQQNPVGQQHIKRGLSEMTLQFSQDRLPLTLFNNDTERYIAMTVVRFNAQIEAVDEFYHRIQH